MTIDRELVAAALPGYEIGGELGRGGWGVVLEGRHRQLERDVAIKQLPAAFAADPSVRERFVAEARVLAALDHPHVVPIYDYVEREDVCLLVMEKLPGGTVWRQFATTGITMPEVCAIVLATCSGLHAAHQKGILHRDVKPENLMFSAAKTLKVTDFGIAKVLTGSQTKATRAGEVLGTPAYMAPEQVQNRELTAATDVYAVGMMLYELLSGRLPFLEDDPIALLFCQVNDVPPPLEEIAPSVPAALSRVTMKALEKRPQDRYATTEELGMALAEAATAAWDPGWLQQSDVPVMATGRMASATMEAQGTAGAAGAARISTPTRPGAPPTVVSGPAAETVAPRPAASAAPAAVVRANAPQGHAKGAVADDVAADDLVGIDEVVKLPAIPTAQVLSALGLLVVCLALAFVGLGASAPKGGHIPARAVTLAGADPAAGKAIPVDLKQPVMVSGALPAAAGAFDHVRMTFSVGGVPLGHADSSLTTPAGGTFTVPLDAHSFQYLLASDTATKLSFERAGQTIAERTFPLRNHQAWYLTVPGALAIALVLFTLAYIEALLRALRRRRKKVTGRVGLVILGGLVGVIAVIWAWLLAAVTPTTTTAIVCALFGAAAGTAGGMAATRMGQRSRMQARR